jgi:hypothetical protein
MAVISKSANCDLKETNKIILRSLYGKNDAAFESVAVENGFIMAGSKKWMQFKLRQ